VINKRDCTIHGEYRNYEEYLNGNKNLFMILVSFAMFIISLMLYYAGLSLDWLYNFMGIITGPGMTHEGIHIFIYM
jgi:hypothetical protein